MSHFSRFKEIRGLPQGGADRAPVDPTYAVPEVALSGRTNRLTDREYAEAICSAMIELGPDVGQEESRVRRVGRAVVNPTFDEVTGKFGEPTDPRKYLEVDIYADTILDPAKILDWATLRAR